MPRSRQTQTSPANRASSAHVIRPLNGFQTLLFMNEKIRYDAVIVKSSMSEGFIYLFIYFTLSTFTSKHLKLQLRTLLI